MAEQKNFKQWLEYFEDEDIDVFSYTGPIDRKGYRTLSDAIPVQKRSKALLILCTFGGDPNAGYRIARAMIHNYGAENFAVLVPSDCKSAGTLVCIGAHQLFMCDRSELGPLDIQVQKQDEIFQQSSGLDIVRGVEHLREDALTTFKDYLFEINAGSGLSTKVASEIASKLVIGLYEPMFAQVDPVRLGEMSAALQIAHEYGTRLSDKAKSLKPDALNKLINQYPAHGFVIDRAEAKGLFERVDRASDEQVLLGEMVSRIAWRDGNQITSYVLHLNTFFLEMVPAPAPDDVPADGNEGSEEATNTAEEHSTGETDESKSSVGDDANSQGDAPGEPAERDSSVPGVAAPESTTGGSEQSNS